MKQMGVTVDTIQYQHAVDYPHHKVWLLNKIFWHNLIKHTDTEADTAAILTI